MNNYFENYENSIKSDIYEHLGSFFKDDSVVFRVWAPNALEVSVVGDFNNWQSSVNPMYRIAGGVWETEIQGIENFAVYKYAVKGADG